MHEVRIPNLGAQIDDAEITEWLASEGARVEAGEVITILETEKSSYDLEASHSGILHIITEVSDDRISVGDLIGIIADSDEEYEKARSK